MSRPRWFAAFLAALLAGGAMRMLADRWATENGWGKALLVGIFSGAVLLAASLLYLVFK